MKLYELPRGTIIQTDRGPLTFDHIDGMYSYCTLEDGSVVHLSAGTPIRKKDGVLVIGASIE
jgi:hypothetical protein